ncbi:IS701 family transposase [Halomonas korlensis]|uniref:SRSO17 transposase n=1 Tax=Halomonas korlensis TaxID=463301 RepID=A0A1I7ILB8_9GAMM|nr:SRSO17 transposase [Halomonas korlensis]
MVCCDFPDSRCFDTIASRLGPLFLRSETRMRAMAYIKGLLSQCERKNGWQLAEWLGDATPDGVQYLLERARWDPEAVRDVLRQWITEYLGSPDGVLILDETGFIKKGQHSAGVQRQYSGTAGRVENSQIGVFLCYASSQGSAFIDRELYLPKAWTQDRERCRKAGIPDEAGFASKPELARRMLERALDKGMPVGWVTGDSVYGGNRSLRFWLEEREQPFVLAVPCNEPLWWQGPEYTRADTIADALSPDIWRRLSAGSGSKGERWYDWAMTPLWRLQLSKEERHWGHYLLIRHSCADPTDRAFYVAFAPRDQVSLDALIRVAGQRWPIEQGFQTAKGECGLDQYEVRRWPGWYRHITLALLAHALLVVMRQTAQQKKHAIPESG